jgi:thiol-disulfide isomerase/thioredoxin
MVSFYFKIDKEIDANNGNGYLFFTVDENGEMAVDANASKENYLVNRGSFYELKGGDAKNALMEIESAVTKNPEMEDKWYISYLQMARRVDKTKLEILIDKYTEDILSKENLSLNDYKTLDSIYISIRQYDKIDSINNIILEKFPESTKAKEFLVSGYFGLETFEEKLNYYNEKELYTYTTDNMTYVHEDLARNYFSEGNNEKFEEFLSKINNTLDKSLLLNTIAWSNVEKGENLDYSAQLSKQSLDLMSAEMGELNEKDPYFSPKQYRDQLKYYYQMYVDTYAQIQHKLGNLDEAIAYQEKAVEDGYSPESNEKYINYLIEDEQYDKVKERATNFIREGNSTTSIKDNLKIAYEKTSPDVDFEPILAELELEAKEKLKDYVKTKLLDQDSTNFTIKNLDGEDVSLNSFVGKTVVLDFWATWCKPCISSFPGMQKAIDKYENNENVVFLFVDTFENGKNREDDLRSFIENNNYDFDVVIDPFSKETSSYQVADAYGVTGIPTKIIIDKEGKLRFKDVGFSGSTDKLVNKLEAMIELIQ